jgi:ketosteroid isomerase-like protein
MRRWHNGVVLIGLMACARPQAPLTDAQREAIADTVATMVRGIFDEGASQRDAARTFRDYAADPDAHLIANGVVFPSLADLRQGERGFFESLESLEARPAQLRVIVLGPDAATVMAPYSFAAKRSGRPVVQGRGVVTFVLQRRGGQWRVVHHHESVVDQARILRELGFTP